MNRIQQQSSARKAALVFNGTCELCATTISWIRGNEEKNAVEMVPCRSEDRKTRHPSSKKMSVCRPCSLSFPTATSSREKTFPDIFMRLRRYRGRILAF